MFRIDNLSNSPRYIFWTRNGETFTSRSRTGVSLETERVAGTSSSDLHISSIRMEDSGEYSCHSDLAIAASVEVYVTSGDKKSVLTCK